MDSIYYSASTGGFYDSAIHGVAMPADAVEITAAERDALLDAQAQGSTIQADTDGRPVAIAPPAPTLADVAASLSVSVQTWLDGVAKANGYDSLASCISYRGSSVAQWDADAIAGMAWRDAVWQAAFQWQQDAQASPPTPLPTAADVIAGLPQPAAYGWTTHAPGAEA
ncbi:hypothetical protein LQ772_06895 [Frateuria edaphi]|uniref:hypothetical protein n=1 Tax=Frateuria edaphi TaxID=2898793 RepID=UPI001E61745F|nr:hypothetical protein [Frateuria edaphi]UGB47013.1 hypothetical protein LQ772_06895 [Frateuria edaphi]